MVRSFIYSGFIVALLIMKFLLRRPDLWKHRSSPIPVDQADNLLTYLILGVILGGRLGYVAFYNLNHYLLNPIDIIKVWDGGMAFHGGFLGVVFAAIYYAKKFKSPIWSLADLVALASPPGLMFGRIANFINAELWGRPTDLPWGVIFPGVNAQNCPGIQGFCARHPSQLYEAGLEGLVLFLLLAYAAKKGALVRAGLITGFFAFGYGLIRFFVEFYRVPDPQFFSDINPNGFAFSYGGFGVTMGQSLCIPMILFGLFLIISNTKARS